MAANAVTCGCSQGDGSVLILPAIDLRGGQCVRLRQGDYADETVFGDPVEMACRWVQQGAKALHLVDLDGAREGRPIHGSTVRKMVAAAGVPCQLGGGVRTEADLEEVLSWGIRRVVIGTRALQDPGWLGELCLKFPGRIVLGVDAREGKVATHGWQEVTEQSALELAARCSSWPLAALVYTDISRDGMLDGPSFSALAEMAKAVSIPVIASGGVTTLEDIRQLAKLPLAGCIIGRALYEGRLNLSEVIQAAGRQPDH